MRIISGIFKSRGLKYPKAKDKVRPTTDKVREAVYDILGDWIKGKVVLDLFCGTGSVGIEALSRGAAQTDFIDTDVDYVRENLSLLGLGKQASVFAKDAVTALRIISSKQKTYDLIYLDPPYSYNRAGEILQYIDDFGILNVNGILIYEHEKKSIINENFNNLVFLKKYFYGQTCLAIYRKIK